MNCRYKYNGVEYTLKEIRDNINNILSENNLNPVDLLSGEKISQSTLNNTINRQVIGEKGAKNLDQIEEATFRMDNLKVAREMEAAGKTPKEIRLASGWERGADKEWGYEILDGELLITLEQLKTTEGSFKLSEIYNNNELFSSYSDLKDIEVVITKGYETYIYVADNTIFIGRQNKTKFTSLLLHELQHAIQKNEGFSQGGSSYTFEDFQDTKKQVIIDNFNKNKVAFINSLGLKKKDTEEWIKDAAEPITLLNYREQRISNRIFNLYTYMALAGEVQARNVQSRMNMSAEERRQTLLEETEDVAREDQIFLMDNLGGSQMSFSPQKSSERITQEIIDKLKQNGLSEDVFLLSTEEINAKLIELGVSEDVRKQVIAWHGSPYSFDKFTTVAMGTGEGAQAFGWGLYFTDLESIAKNYAKTLVDKVKNSVELKNNIELSNESSELRGRLLSRAESVGFAEQVFKSAIKDYESLVETPIGNPYGYDQIMTEDIRKRDVSILEDLKKMYNGGFKISEKSKNLYKVSLHKGKTPSEYTWLEWDKRPSLDTIGQFIDYVSDNIAKSESSKYNLQSKKEDIFAGRTKIETGKSFYQGLAKSVMQVVGKNTDKDISLALLEAGIDGIKYPAESIARGAMSDTARGFNYVVFDENAITIEEQIQFQKALNNVGINLITNGLTYKDSKTGKDIVILNKDTATDETAIHEFSHIFSKWQKENRPELWKKGQDLSKDAIKSGEIKEIVDYVKQTQPKLKEGSEAFYDEILQEYVGRTSKEMMDEQKQKSPLMQWLSDFWDEIRKSLGLLSMTPEQVANLSLRDFARASVVDLLKGENFVGKDGQTNFEKWKGKNTLVETTEIQDVKTGQPIVAKAYHGTTNEFYEFDSSVKGNVEGHLGKVNYFTSDYGDANENYLAEGGDITGRIDRRQDEIEDELSAYYNKKQDALNFKDIVSAYNIEDADIELLYPSGTPKFIQAEEISRFLAEKELKGGTEQVLEVYVKLNNPVVLGNGSTWFEALEIDETYIEEATQEVAEEYGITEQEAKDEYDYEIRDRAVEKQGDGNKVVEALEKALHDNSYDTDKVGEILGDNYYESEIDLNELEKSLRTADLFDNYEGEIASSQVIADFFKNLGFDGIILTDVSKRFRGMRLGTGTSHIHVFDEFNNQIKLADGSNVTFGETPDIRYQVIGEKGASRVAEYQQSLNQAKTLEKQGKDYSETGWFKNKQGQWKYFSNEILNEFLDFPQIKNKTVNLKDLLKKDSILLKAYPQLNNVKVEFYEGTKGADFRANPEISGTVTQGGTDTILYIRTDSKIAPDTRRTVAHELNHKIQSIENFSRGGSPESFLKFANQIAGIELTSDFQDYKNKMLSFDRNILNKEDIGIVKVIQDFLKNDRNSKDYFYNKYLLLQGEIDSRAVELAITLKDTYGTQQNLPYSALIKALAIKENNPSIIDQAIDLFYEDNSASQNKQTVVEPNATFNGFNSYSEAVKNTPINDTIKIDIAGVNVAEVTNNGDINDLIRQDIILDERELTPSGEIVFTTAGNSITKKLVNAEIAKEVIKGTINEDGNIVAKEKVELTKVSDDFNKNKKEFGESTALSILASQILLNNTPTLGNNRIIDYSIEIPSDNVLMTKLKNLLQELGIKTMSLEEWAKNYKTRTGQEPTANSLADISNRIIAFANGQVNQDTLSEEVMHFIVEALPQEQVQPLLDMIHKTDEWKQYAAQYTEIYKDDNTVRREILGKVLKNYIQSQQEQSTLQGQSVVRRLLDMVDKLIAQIRGLFKPQHQAQLDKFTEEIYQKLMKEELYSELSPSQFDGNTLVMYQAEPSTIYDYLTKTLEAFDSLDRKTGGQNKFELSLLDVENRDELNQLKATAALSATIKTKIKYLTKRGRQSGFLSVEEQQVYDVALNELAPTLGKLKNIISEKPFSNAFLKQQVLENVTQTMTELSELSTALNEDNQKVFDTLVEDVAEQTGLTPEMTEVLKNEIKTLQRDTNQFYSLYGSLSQAQSPILNILSTVISDAERESIIQYDRRQSEFINAAKALGFKEEEIAVELKKFKDGHYFISEWDFEAIEKEKAVFRAEAYSEVTGTPITAEEFLKGEEKLLKKLPQKQRNTYNFRFKEKVDKSGMHHDRLTKEERAKANSLIEGFSEKTKRFLADQAKIKGAIAQRIKDNNGASKEDNNSLKELAQQRQRMANPYDEYGSLHKGLQINIAGEVSKSPTFDDFNTKDSDREIATTILELAEYNKKIVAEYKDREAIEGKQPVPQSFIDKVQEMRGNGGIKGIAKAMEFLLMNTRISYNSNFWEMFEKTNGLIEKLRESSNAGALSTADDIQKNRTRLKNILKEHRDYNNPSQIDFENLGGAESTIKEISSDLEHLYEKAKSYLRDNETLKKTTESESVTNKAYGDVIQDRGIDLITNRKDYEARLDYILKHVTPNSRARILRNADSFISYKKGHSKKLPKSIEKFENRSEGKGFKEAEEVATYEDIIDYAESLLLPYFKELKPTNFDMQEFVTNLVKAGTEAEFNKVIEEAEYVTVTPSYSLVDSEDNKRLNPEYAKAYEANDPTINLDYKGGILRSKNYIEMFAPDSKGNVTKNVKQKQLLDLAVGFWADSIESANMTNSFNKYQLPGIRRGSLARKEQLIKNFSAKNLKESIKDIITVREDDPIFGQVADIASRGALTIPRIGFSKLETAEEVTDELLYSLMHTANQAEKRKQRINSLDKIEAVKTRLRGASYGDKTGEATTAYEMADDFIRYNIYGQTETFKWETDFFGLTSKKYNLAPVIKHFQGWTRLVGLGYSTLVPLTSFLQGSTNFVVENIVGDRINATASRLAARKAGQLVAKATKEEFMSDLKTKSELNLLMQFFGLSNPIDNFQNSNYGRTLRGLAPENSAYFSHFMGDLPLTAQTIMTVLYDFKVVEVKDDKGKTIGTKLQSYSEWRNDNKALRIAGNVIPATEKEAMAEWKLNDKYLYNYIETKKDGSGEIVGMQMNSEYYKLFAGKEKYANDRLNFVKRKITTVKQEIDNQIPNEDKSYIQRHAIFSFVSMFKGFLITAVNKRFKDRHRSNQTNMLEEGTYKGTSAFLGALINSGRKGSFKDFWKEQYREFDGGYKLETEGTEYAIYDTSKEGNPEVFRTTDKAKADSAYAQLTVQATQMRQVSLKRAGLDFAVTASLATIALLLKGLADDDDDDYIKEFVAYMSYRVAVETTSQSTGIAGQLYSFIESPTAGISQINNLINIGDLGSSEITKSGTYRGYSERDALLYRSLPLMKEYFRLKEIDRSRQDYKKYNKHFIDNFNFASLMFDEEARK